MAKFKQGNLVLTTSQSIIQGATTVISNARKGFFSEVELDVGVSIVEFSIDGTLTDNVDTKLPTQKAIKTYVDTEISTISTNKIDQGDSKVEVTDAGTGKVEVTIDSTLEGTWDPDGLSLKAGASINEFSTDGTLTDDSDDAVPTEKAVKTYVDNLSISSEQDSYQDLLSTSKYQNLTFDDFTDTSLIDSGSTTMTYVQTGSKYTFTTGEILQSEDLFDSQSGVVEITECMVEMIYTDSSTSASTLEITADGTNWESATLNTIHTFSNTGTTLKMRYTAGGSGNIKSWGIFYNPSSTDLVEPVGNVVAIATLTDNYLVRGDSADTNVQVSTVNVTDNGEMTNPSQPAFNVKPTIAQENIAVSTNVNIIFGTERFDIGNNFASNVFTAPITGKYQFNVILRLDLLDTDAAYYWMYLVTSNLNYSGLQDFDMLSADASYRMFNLSVLADMDANDTAFVRIFQSGGVSQTDINALSNFSGALIC